MEIILVIKAVEGKAKAETKVRIIMTITIHTSYSRYLQDTSNGGSAGLSSRTRKR